MKFPYNRVLEIKKQYQDGAITREEAKELMAFVVDLTDGNDACAEAIPAHERNEQYRSYGPLVRLSDVCNILRTWAHAYVTPAVPQEDWQMKDRSRFQEAWSFIDLQIRKSCLLDRLFFQTEGLRTVPCPVHKGRWSGCDWSSPGCECRNGSNVTGWLPAAEDTGYTDSSTLCDFCGKPPLKQGLWSSRVDGKHGHPECMDKDDGIQR
jgi:hypothetical protein